MNFMREGLGPLLPASQQINQYSSNHDQSEAQHGGSSIQMDSSNVVCSVSLHGSSQHNSNSIMLEESQKTPNVSHDTNENAAKTPKSQAGDLSRLDK
jgi:hypothetical protein